MATKIDPKRIRIDCDTQSRVEMNEAVIGEYAEAMERGEEFPAILVFFDEESNEFILADGFHRYFAHLRAKPNDPILAEQRLGTIEDARWASLAANQSHGLRRTNADKRNAAKRALIHRNGFDMSNRQVAKYVGVNDKTVAVMREELEASAEIPQMESRTVRRGDQVYQQKVKKSKNEGKSCSQCMNFSEAGTCIADGEKRMPWTDACEDFELVREGIRPRELPPPPTEYQLVDPVKKRKRKTNTQKYKPRNTTIVDVPLDNPNLAAIELRESLGEDYLEQCFIAVRVLLDQSQK